MEARNKELLRNFIREVWSEGKVDAAGDYLHPAIRFITTQAIPGMARRLTLPVTKIA